MISRRFAAPALAACLALAACGSDASRPAALVVRAVSDAYDDASRSALLVPRPAADGTGLPRIPGGPTGPAHASASTTVSSPPVRVRIPAIGVNSKLQSLGLDAKGVLQPPTQWGVAGWYAAGVRPGDVGPALIAGHVDSVSGPAVFYRLRDLRPGDRIHVDRADGTSVTFVVARTDEYPKRTFPTEAVYGPTSVPTLRLVTCAGDFDRAKRSYVDNLVVTAYEE